MALQLPTMLRMPPALALEKLSERERELITAALEWACYLEHRPARTKKIEYMCVGCGSDPRPGHRLHGHSRDCPIAAAIAVFEGKLEPAEVIGRSRIKVA